MEVLTALVCMLPCCLVPLLALGVWMGLAAGRRNTERVVAQTAVLEAIGLEARDDSDWRVGTIGGRAVAVKAMRTAKTHNYVEYGGRVQLGIKLVALVPLAVPLEEQIFQNNPGRSATTLEQHFYTLSGQLPAGLPEPVSTGLLAWATEVPTDGIEVGPRDAPHLYVGSQLADAVSVVRVESSARVEPGDLMAWLEACVARVQAMEAVEPPA